MNNCEKVKFLLWEVSENLSLMGMRQHLCLAEDFYCDSFLPTKMDRTDKRIRILAHTIELIILPALNKKKIKIIAKAAAANKVL